MDTRPTASIIIIGDEILKGQTQDTNSYFLCRELYKCGIRVARVSVISDDIDAIGEEVLSQSNKYTYVITSGGIGPTHDDVTYEGIAKAFDETLTLNKQLLEILAHLCLRLNLNESAAYKMAHVPQTAEIHQTGDGFIPIISVRNVYIFPGIPSYLECAFNKLKSVFSVLATPYFNRCLFVNANEFEIAEILNAAVKEFEQEVKFGSYPEINSKYFQVKLVLEANSKNAITDAEAYLRSHLPSNSVVREHPPNSEDALKLMLNIFHKTLPPFDSPFCSVVEKSLEILEKCFEKYSFQDTCLSFNGGKDCTVLLHLTFLFLINKNLTQGKKLKVLYVRTNQPFPEIEEFIEQCKPRYNLKVITYNQSIKEALVKLKNDNPEIKAVLMGSRLTDPHCSTLQAFQKTDDDWPQFMRVNPLTHWSYSDVWTFLRELDVPYCSLYDKGYTSLGCPHNTLPNEQLLTTTKEGISYYKPAYLLNDPKQERKGRSVKKSL